MDVGVGMRFCSDVCYRLVPEVKVVIWLIIHVHFYSRVGCNASTVDLYHALLPWRWQHSVLFGLVCVRCVSLTTQSPCIGISGREFSGGKVQGWTTV